MDENLVPELNPVEESDENFDSELDSAEEDWSCEPETNPGEELWLKLDPPEELEAILELAERSVEGELGIPLPVLMEAPEKEA